VTDTETVTSFERIAGELAELRNEFDRMLGQLADAELQLKDVRSERDQQHHLAAALKTERDEEHRLAEALKAALDHSAGIEQAIGIIAEKAGVGIPEARARLKGYSRAHDKQIRAVAASIVAAQDPKSSTHLAADVAGVITHVAGIPLEFWNALTLDGAIFE
jgi:cation transport ATPase